MGQRIRRISNLDPDLDRPNWPPKQENMKKFMFEEFKCPLEEFKKTYLKVFEE
jgi:hypothetical protein